MSGLESDCRNRSAISLESAEKPHIVEPFFQIENLSLCYGNKTAFADVTLSIETGAITALVGPSGCGKTSFLFCLNRLIDMVSGCRVSGRIRMGNSDLFSPKLDVIELRRRVGMIFQKPNPFPFSIRRNIEFPLREHGVRDRVELAARLESALRDVGLWEEVKDRLDTSALALSGGQQQRLCIARALALKPAALLLDEPCSALDPISSGVVEDLIVSLESRYTVIIVTHNLAQARRIADYTAFFWVGDGMGRLIEYGNTQQIFESPQEALTAAYVNGVRG
ncbi:MAG: phosphate ABC transporter ATP-binding protein [Acidobacteriota bacterium]